MVDIVYRYNKVNLYFDIDTLNVLIYDDIIQNQHLQNGIGRRRTDTKNGSF